MCADFGFRDHKVEFGDSQSSKKPSTRIYSFVTVAGAILSIYILSLALHHEKRLQCKDDNGSAGHGSRVKWVNKSEWFTCVTGQYS